MCHDKQTRKSSENSRRRSDKKNIQIKNKMEYAINNYSIGKSSFNYDIANYREMYSQNSFAQQMYKNIVRYVPTTINIGDYIK